MKFGWGVMLYLIDNFFNMFVISSSLITIIDEPGKTPVKRLDNRGISSAMSLGTKVSQRDFKRMFCSHYSSIKLGSAIFSFSARLRLPELTSTLFNARKPKS